MNELIELKRNEAVTTSLQVAESFSKKHKTVIRNIENLVAQNCAAKMMFHKGTYKDKRGKEQPIYFMNRDGFSFLVMGFTGKEAFDWKLKYIEAFNKMEKLLQERATNDWLEERRV